MPRARRTTTATAQARTFADLPAKRPRASAHVSSPYESGTLGTRRTQGWRAPTVSPNTSILSTLVTLRDRSRAATRNNGYAKGVIDHLVTNIIGTGIKPRSMCPDPAFRKAVQALWTRWTDESDADGQLDFYGQQAQAVRAWLEGGETFARQRPRLLADGLSVPLQAQIVEPELCPHTYNAVLPTGNRVRAGIEFNGIGKRVAYWFYPSRPGDLLDFDPTELRRIPAESVSHIYDPLRPGQLRGLPHLTQALVRLHETDKMDDATLLRQQLSNMFVAFLTRATPTEGDTSNPFTGTAAETSDDDKPMLSLEPGVFQELNPGEKVDFSEPPPASPAYAEFMRQQLYHIAAATNVPYETLTGDLSRVNDRTVRVILHEFRRKVSMWQHQIVVFQFCRPFWNAWMDRAYLTGALPFGADYVTNPDKYRDVRFIPQGWPYLNPVQDIDASKGAVRAGFSTRSSEVAAQGDDAEDIDAENAADNERADELNLRYDSDGRQPATGPKQTETIAEAGDGTLPAAAPATTNHVTVAPADVHVDAPVTVSPPSVTIAEGAIQMTVHMPSVPGGRKRVERDANNRITGIVADDDQE